MYKNGRFSLIKLPVRADQWSNQSPYVDNKADPAGGDFHPHGWHTIAKLYYAI